LHKPHELLLHVNIREDDHTDVFVNTSINAPYYQQKRRHKETIVHDILQKIGLGRYLPLPAGIFYVRQTLTLRQPPEWVFPDR
jgi:hypothetical protein